MTPQRRATDARPAGPPRHFLCGAATASHQVEGGNVHNDWWEYEQAGRLPFKSGEACRHFERYESDFDLARSLGHNAHRFSLEWSRIEPARGQWDRQALGHYERVVDALLQRGLEPILTLHHFTNPAWFARAGGWTARDSVACFRRYVEYVAPVLLDRVRFVITLNEPTVFVKRAYVVGDWPPCRPGAWREGLLAMRNQCRAHAAAYDVLHRVRHDVQVGLAHSAPYVQPQDSGRRLDRIVAAARDFVLNDLCFHLLPGRPADVLDFIGLNYYTRQLVTWRRGGMASLVGAEVKAAAGERTRRFNSMNWEIYPDGLRAILRRFARHGLPLLVTENGMSTDDEVERDRFLAEHLAALEAARSEGLPVFGYLYWTLMDNFEWTEGLRARFGLAAVDFATQERTPRPAAARLREYCLTRAGPDDAEQRAGGR
jgi:beta-glucosidase